MVDEKSQEQEAPAAVVFTNSMTQAILSAKEKYLPGYRFVLVGYTPDIKHPIVEAAIGTNLSAGEVQDTLKIILQIIEAQMKRDPRVSIVPIRRPDGD